MSDGWVELADGVFMQRHESWDLNTGLVVGDERCLVIDTCVSCPQGRDLARSVRNITVLPWVLVNTHAHVDHVLGNAAFGAADIWSHTDCARRLAEHGEADLEELRSTANTAERAELDETRVVVPNRTFDQTASIDLGGRTTVLRHIGRGHTAGDIVVDVPGPAVCFAGDLVRESGAPWFADAFPLDWPATLRRLEDGGAGAIVPGHGKVVDRDFVAGQRDLLTTIAETLQAAYGERRAVEDVAPQLPLPPRSARDAVARTYACLAAGPGA